MLETVDLKKKIPKADYKKQMPHLQQRLYDLQQANDAAGIPAIIVIEGWKASGRESTIRKLVQRLDPRGVKIYNTQPPRTYETHMPWLWRFWLKIPNYGEIAIFNQSWYRRVLVERVEKQISEEQWHKAYRDIVNFERTLVDDGYLIFKFFLHLSKGKQRKRFEKLEDNPLKSWRVSPRDWNRHRKYKQYAKAVEDMLQRTTTEHTPWNIVAANQRRWAKFKILTTLITQFENVLQQQGQPLPAGAQTISEELFVSPDQVKVEV